MGISVYGEEAISLDVKDVGFSSTQIKLLGLVELGEYAAAKELLNSYNINSRTKDGVSLLWWAVNAGDYESFMFFLENGANPLGQTLDTYNVMELCAFQEDQKFLEGALKFGGNANLISYHGRVTPIFVAVKYHRFNNVQVLLNSGASVSVADNIGRTPALWASEANAFKILLMLLEKGSDPTVKDIWGLNVLESLNEKELESSNPQLSYLKKAISFIEEKWAGSEPGSAQREI
jgi:ankyrin repeat protein